MICVQLFCSTNILGKDKPLLLSCNVELHRYVDIRASTTPSRMGFNLDFKLVRV